MDIGKRWLDVGLARSEAHLRIGDDVGEFDALIAWLRAHGVELAKMMTFYEHVSGLLAKTRTVAEHQRLKTVTMLNAALVSHLKAEKQRILQTPWCQTTA